MPHSSSMALSASHRVLRLLIILNIAVGVFFLFILAGSFVAEGEVLRRLESRPDDGVGALSGLRLVVLLGLLAVPLAHIMFARLLAIVNTVRAGDPFVAENARRLTWIAWALLGMQLLDLAFGAVTLAYLRDFGWSPGIVGWLAVLLLFVLARVFERGAAMREELEGTV